MVIMLLSVSFAYLVLTTPFYVRGVLNYVWNTAANAASDPALFNTVNLLNFSSFFLYQMNFSINFFLYVVSGKRFRKDLLDIFCCKRTMGKKRRMGTQSGNITKSTNVSAESVKGKSSDDMPSSSVG